jgi:hypothetical protein
VGDAVAIVPVPFDKEQLMFEPLPETVADAGGTSSADSPVWQPVLPLAEPLPAPDAPARAMTQKRSSRSVPALLSVVALVAVAGLCFAFGRISAPAQSTAGANGADGLPAAFASGAPGAFGSDRGAGLGGLASVTGTVVSVSGSSITVQLADGQTVQLATDSATTYHSQTAATIASVAAGSKVQVQVSGGGQPNAAASASPSSSGSTRTATDVTVTAS